MPGPGAIILSRCGSDASWLKAFTGVGCRWHAVAGFKEKAFRMQNRPMLGVIVKERQGARRIKELQETAHVSPPCIWLRRSNSNPIPSVLLAAEGFDVLLLPVILGSTSTLFKRPVLAANSCKYGMARKINAASSNLHRLHAKQNQAMQQRSFEVLQAKRSRDVPRAGCLSARSQEAGQSALRNALSFFHSTLLILLVLPPLQPMLWGCVEPEAAQNEN